MPRCVASRIRCLGCGDLIESKHRHDLVTCTCEEVFLDGGLSYMRIGGPLDGWKNESVYQTIPFDLITLIDERIADLVRDHIESAERNKGNYRNVGIIMHDIALISKPLGQESWLFEVNVLGEWKNLEVRSDDTVWEHPVPFQTEWNLDSIREGVALWKKDTKCMVRS